MPDYMYSITISTTIKERACRTFFEFVRFIFVQALLIGLLISPTMVGAQWGENLNVGPGFGTGDPIEVVIDFINIVLGFLALIVFVIILLAGFNWMTSAGDPGKIKQSQARIKAAIIGLIVIIFSWAIASFVFNVLKNV